MGGLVARTRANTPPTGLQREETAHPLTLTPPALVSYNSNNSIIKI